MKKKKRCWESSKVKKVKPKDFGFVEVVPQSEEKRG